MAYNNNDNNNKSIDTASITLKVAEAEHVMLEEK
jgi:hypothetical protein